MIPININEIASELEIQSESHPSYLNRETGEIVTIPEEFFSVAESGEDFSSYPDWEKELIEAAEDVLASEKYVPLPSEFDIHEYRIMEDFCYSMEGDKVQQKLLRAIDGKGAFRRFRDNIFDFGIEQRWYRFKQEALKKIAIEWCEENEIPYVEGPPRAGQPGKA